MVKLYEPNGKKVEKEQNLSFGQMQQDGSEFPGLDKTRYYPAFLGIYVLLVVFALLYCWYVYCACQCPAFVTNKLVRT